MAAWSFAPWLIALLIAAGLGVFGWISDHKSRQRRAEAESDQGSGSDDG
jgi:hypothetical protein